MTNTEFANSLRLLADVYDTQPEAKQFIPRIYTWDKPSLLKQIAAFGGKFTKEYQGDYLLLHSVSIPGFLLHIDRNKVCTKIVTYDCTPLLSEEDEAEVGVAAGITDDIPY